MAFKPFKPPSTKGLLSQKQNLGSSDHVERPAKRQRLGLDHENHPQAVTSIPSQIPNSDFRAPLNRIHNLSDPSGNSTDLFESELSTETQCFSILWRKLTQKKHKTWDDDGYLSVQDGQATLYDSKMREMGCSKCSGQLEDGNIILVSGKEVEIGDKIDRKEFQAKLAVESRELSVAVVKTSCFHENVSPTPKITFKEQLRIQLLKDKKPGPTGTPSSTTSSARRLPFKQPLKNNTVLPQIPSETPIPRHDPALPGAVVFKRPRKAPGGQQLVDVVLDPLLGDQLREHQKVGVKFMYECVMGLRDFGGEGCILADDMGLGKTLQTIALLWTLIKQNPIHKAEPVVKKALIVCPVTLIQNWKKEFRKWLGRDRLGVLTFDDKGSRLSMFDGKNFKVMIVGYERLRTIAEDLNRGACIDIVVCDEGHRLKTLQNKSAKAIESLNTSKRIILSGTPIQNDLSEFFAMANFVNDGVLGSYKSFTKEYETPIMKSRQPNATEDEIEKGEFASEQLAKTTSSFILRRTGDVLLKYLPPKTEYVLFCKPTPEQANIYRQVLASPMFQNALGSSETALQLITILKKLCNSPALMRPDKGNDESTSSNSLVALSEMLPQSTSRHYSNRYSTKIRLLDELLREVRTTTDDKVILVSNYTSTLNLMAQLLDNSGGRYLRLDGSTPQGKRQGLVDEFNKSPASACFAFLLSAKAGGIGLNLVGANRLVLFDVDWNPSTDDQAMARIHREGQKKPCKIYRFIMKGGIEEKIWQRQVVKRGLADSILDPGSSTSGSTGLISTNKKGKAAFSKEELRDLFRLDEQDGLRTHDLIGCRCKGLGLCSESDSLVGSEANLSDSSSETDADNLPDVAALIKASLLTQNYLAKQKGSLSQHEKTQQDRASRKTGHEKQELMRFQHLDTSTVPDLSIDGDAEAINALESKVNDDCLMHVLKLDTEIIAGRVAYIFKKMTGSPATDLSDVI